MKEKIVQTISNIMNYPLKDINENTSPDDIETWDSLNQMNLVLALEEEFGITFTDDEIVSMLDVQSIIKILENSASQ